MAPSSDWKVEIVDASGDADYSVTVVGDQVVDLTGASDGDVLTVQPDGTVAPEANVGSDLRKPAVAIAETFPRGVSGSNSTLNSAVSGTLYLSSIPLRAGQQIGSVSACSAVASVASTHTWFAIYSPALGLLAVTVDDVSAVWAADNVKTLALATPPLVIATSGLYYLGVVQVAGTPASLRANAVGVVIMALAPALGGQSTAGLVAPATAPDPAAAPTGIAAAWYGYVS